MGLLFTGGSPRKACSGPAPAVGWDYRVERHQRSVAFHLFEQHLQCAGAFDLRDRDDRTETAVTVGSNDTLMTAGPRGHPSASFRGGGSEVDMLDSLTPRLDSPQNRPGAPRLLDSVNLCPV